MSRFRATTSVTGGVLLGVALTVITIQAWSASAAPGDTDATYQPLAPCRLIDTRPEFNVGDRIAPLGPGETFTAQVTGSNGECIGIPADAIGVATNVTAVNPTAPSFLTVFPADLGAPPTASNLNYANGSPPTPNKVDVKLSPDGKIKLFNAFGTVDVIVDVVGVYINSSLTEIEARLAALETARAFVVSSGSVGQIPINARTVVNSVDVTAPVAGRVFVTASATAVEDTGGDDVRCAIGTSPTPLSSNSNDAIFEAAGTEGDAGGLARNRSFSIAAGVTQRYYFSCESTASPSEVWGAQVDAIFLPD